MSAVLEPGMLVRHPEKMDWGLGQVQSVIGARVTVNFEHAGKVVIDSNRIALILEFGV
jgi:FKBP-type peptidyl-prolyl cis-trans isomerase 2